MTAEISIFQLPLKEKGNDLDFAKFLQSLVEDRRRVLSLPKYLKRQARESGRGTNHCNPLEVGSSNRSQCVRRQLCRLLKAAFFSQIADLTVATDLVADFIPDFGGGGQRFFRGLFT